MERSRNMADWMTERNLRLDDLLESTGLDRKVLDAIIHGRYTPSPQQRQRLAQALGVDLASITWGHTQQVEHIHGHGPQFGRSP
jgi:transcriptional regulator with XRE-family HTH domain